MSRRATLHGQLLDQAQHLAKRDRTKPQQGNLRRAVSSAYYGLFHLLVSEAASSFFTAKGTNADRIRESFARCLGHGPMKEVCLLFCGQSAGWPKWLEPIMGPAGAVPPELSRVARAFFELQEARHAADYDTSRGFSRREVLTLVGQASAAEKDWLKVRKQEAATIFLLALTLPALNAFQKRVP